MYGHNSKLLKMEKGNTNYTFPLHLRGCTQIVE
uniref:Uncharacterized protein n=1 Tax=Anguilla anguilla TaxID=7936 RepID=A0A0E9SPC0_ANGAN